jgi:ABC-type spermidine/putrescine transport system permease subunit I
MPNLAKRWLIFLCVAILPVFLIVAPIISFLIMSLYRVENNQIVQQARLDNYINFFSSWTYFGTFLGTLLLCLEVVFLSLALGYPVAWFIWRQRGKQRYVLLLLAVLPLFMSYIPDLCCKPRSIWELALGIHFGVWCFRFLCRVRLQVRSLHLSWPLETS